MKTSLTFLILISLIFLNSSLTFSQYKFGCAVTDASGGEPVEESRITISPDEVFEVTDKTGECFFNNITESKITVTIERIGYKYFTKEIILERESDNYFKFSIEQSDILSGEIKVYSTKIENQLKYAILPVSLITKKDFDFLPVISTPDMMKYKPGINLVRDGIWATDINIRGLSRDNIIVIINGNRIETANNQAARFSLIDGNTVERIEVIKGGVSSVYGSGGTGGIVSIKTETGNFSDDLKLKGIISGQFFTVNKLAGSSMSLMISDKIFNANVQASYNEASDIKTPGGVIPNSSFRDMGISAYTGIKLWKNHEINLEYQKFKSPYAGIPGSYPLFPSQAKVTYIPAERDMFAAGYRIREISGLIKNFSARFFLQNIFRNTEVIPNSVVFIPPTATTPAAKINNLLINPEGKHYTKGLQFTADLVKDNSKLVTGIDIWQRKLITTRERTQYIERFDSLNNLISATTLITGDIPIPESKYSSVGFYVNDETSFNNDKIYLNIGGRIDGIFVSNEQSLNPAYTITNGVKNNSPANQKVLWEASESSEISWSYNSGANYKMTDKINLSGNFSASFRSPSLEERFQYIDLGSIVRVGNPALNPELGYFLSASAKYWGEDLNLSLELFSNFLSDLITEIPGTFENRPALIKTNIGSARLAGFEVQSEYNFYKGFTFYGNLSFVNGENTGDKSPLPQIPPLNGLLGLKFYTESLFSLNFNSVLFSSQNRTAAGELKTPGYVIYNLYSGFDNINAGSFKFSVTAGIENLFDKSYREHLSTARGSYVSEPGRNLFLKTKLIF
ncbi:MAG: TonB-dependent receptor [Ignavibacteria bacterium]|nr:TonB-dependent receptor [Ignavibacteria bacterium]